MKKVLLIVLIGIVTVIVGGVMLVISLNKSDKESIVTTTHDLESEFSDISINVATANVEIKVGEKAQVECEEKEKSPFTVEIENNELRIAKENNEKWYEKILTFGFKNEKVTIYLTQKEYGKLMVNASTGSITSQNSLTFSSINLSISTSHISLKENAKEELKISGSTGKIDIKDSEYDTINIENSTGDINIENVKTTGNINIALSTGDVSLNSIDTKDLRVHTTTGDITLSSVLCEDLKLDASTGKIKFEKTDCTNATLETSTGNISGSFKTPKIIFATTSTGKIKVDESTIGAKCTAKTSTGNIEITFEN